MEGDNLIVLNSLYCCLLFQLPVLQSDYISLILITNLLYYFCTSCIIE